MRIRNYGKKKKKQIKQIRNEGLPMVAKFPDTSGPRQRTERQTKARGKGRGGEKERDKYWNVVFMEVHRRGCGGRSDAKAAALFSTLGNILESWRKPSLPLLYSRLLSIPAHF